MPQGVKECAKNRGVSEVEPSGWTAMRLSNLAGASLVSCPSSRVSSLPGWLFR